MHTAMLQECNKLRAGPIIDPSWSLNMTPEFLEYVFSTKY